MGKISPLKRARLLSRMTQAAAAKELGVSQSTYQRWEAGTLAIPEKKAAQIAKVLRVSTAVILGKREPFDLLGIDKSVDDDRTYYGELALHFRSDGEPLLLPITVAVFQSVHDSLQGEEPFIRVESLDNRMVFVRRAAISDVYFSSDAYDDYGPETGRYEEILGIFPEDDFWRVAEALEYLPDAEDDFDPEVLADAKSSMLLTNEELDALIASGSVEPEDRQKVEAEVAERAAKFVALARNVTWQMGRRRRILDGVEGAQLFESFAWLAEDDFGEFEQPIFLSPEGYHRSVIIQPGALDYISIPAHKFREGEIENAELEDEEI